MSIAERKARIRRSVQGRLEIHSELRLEADLNRAKSHADLDRLEDDLESSEAAAEEEELYGLDGLDSDTI